MEDRPCPMLFTHCGELTRDESYGRNAWLPNISRADRSAAGHFHRVDRGVTEAGDENGARRTAVLLRDKVADPGAGTDIFNAVQRVALRENFGQLVRLAGAEQTRIDACAICRRCGDHVE